MNKIKQINISDFRIYQGKQEFNFQNNRGTANLVALYAPNGFGKTSFFDAVEWGYSDKIDRIGQRTNNEVQELDYNEELRDKIILTNRSSYKNDPNVRGHVEILTEKGFFNKKVSLYTRRNTNGTKNDYREGIVNGNLKIDNGNKLVNSNILTQDQIDRFLRYLSPEEKFQELKDFWTEGEETLNKYKKVDEAFKQIINKITQNKSDKLRLNKEFEKIVFDPQKISDINNALDKLDSNQLLTTSFTRLEEPLTVELFKKLSKELNITNQKISNTSQEKKKLKEDIEKIIDKFDIYQKNKVDLNKIRNDQVEIKLKKKNFDSLNSTIEKKNELEEQSSLNKQVLDDYRDILKALDLFLDTKKSVNKSEEEIAKCKTNIEKTDFNQFLVSKWHRSLAKGQSIVQNEYDLIVGDLNVIKVQSEKYFFDKKENEQNKEQLPKLQKKLKKIQNKIDKKNSLITSYQEANDTKQWAKLSLQVEKWDQKVYELKLLSDQVKSKSDDLKLKKKALQKSGTLEENLKRIKLWGEEYVQETKQENCPLCNRRYDDFEKLLEQIKISTKDFSDVTDQKKEIEKVEKEIKDLVNEIEEIHKFFNDNIKAEIDELRGEIRSEAKLKGDKELEVNAIIRKTQFFTAEYKNFTTLLSKYLEKEEKLSDKLITKVTQGIKNKKRILLSKKERIERILDNISVFSISNDKKKAQYLKSISEHRKDINEKQGKDQYKKVVELIARYKIKTEELDHNGIEELEDIRRKEYETLLWHIKVKSRYIIFLNRAIDSSPCGLSEKLISREIIKKESEKNELLKKIREYEYKYEMLIDSTNYSQDELMQKLAFYNKTINAYSNYEKDLISVIADLQLMEVGIRQKDITDQLSKITEEDKKLDKLKEKVSILKKSCMSYIRDGISNYFNKDVINQIYQRIEPHPEFKEIEFKADVGKKGPRLLITAKGSDEVNPNLYLSAGQVNVLSLSIFLAKAFEYGMDTISTIFMDDPIQNLSDINILSFIDILRTLTNEHDKQIVISTHDEKFFRLLQNKLPEEYCNSKYIEFESEGKIKRN
ncbi:MAG: hypothetical protein N4A49_01680 [Marinifilaceae bacterium]|jgi:DNA repair exonuclease SbcCD ATPase subunit|nr:hypothetical protein [Marinifilaceae bacterium]